MVPPARINQQWSLDLLSDALSGFLAHHQRLFSHFNATVMGGLQFVVDIGEIRQESTGRGQLSEILESTDGNYRLIVRWLYATHGWFAAQEALIASSDVQSS
jgi:hypothetical protein